MGDSPSSRDRRRGRRVPVHSTVAELFLPDHREGLRIVRDMSLYGLYLFGETEARLYDRCYLKIEGPKRKSMIELALKIVRVDPRGVGLEFLDVPFDTCELLRTLILYKAKDPVEAVHLFDDECEEPTEETDPSP